MNRNKKLLLLSLVCLIIFSACSPNTEDTTPQELAIVKLNGAKYLTFAPIFIADEKGYFKDQDIQIEYIPFTTATDALPGLLIGDIDVFAGVLSSGLLNVLGKEEIIKVVADRGFIDPEGCSYMALLLRKDLLESGNINGPTDLAGLTITSNEGGSLGYLLDEYISQGGLSFNDLEISNIPPPNAGDALEKGQLDGCVLAEPWLTRVESSGKAIAFVKGQDVIPYYQIGIVAFGEELLKTNPDVGVRFMAAYLQGVNDYNQGKTDENLKIVAEYTELSIDILEDACWPSVSGEDGIQYDGVEAFQTWAIESGFLDNPITEEQFWDSSFIENAIAQNK